MNDWNAAEDYLIEKMAPPEMRLHFKLLKALRQAHILEPVTVSVKRLGLDFLVRFYWGCDADHFSINIDIDKAYITLTRVREKKWDPIADFISRPIDEERIPEFVKALGQVQSMHSLGF